MGFTFEDGECRMCGDNTETVVNIKMSAVSICDECCDAITKQNVLFLINEKIPKLTLLTGDSK